MNNSDRVNEQSQIESSQATPSRILEVRWAYRWEVYRRLKMLDIQCTCTTNEPLRVYLHSPTTAIQIWSVLRQCGTDRRELIDWLENCWGVKSHSRTRKTDNR
ncbi:MAG: Asr1405/Asl0597 family protein [Cyanobacteria bacterium P01_G01_bin.19]